MSKLIVFSFTDLKHRIFESVLDELGKLYDGLPSNTTNEYWVFGVILFLLAVMAFTRVFYYHLILERINAFFAIRYFKQLIRRELILFHPYSLITLFLFALSVGLIVTKAIMIYQPDLLVSFTDYIWCLMATGAALGWILIRAVVYKIVQGLIGVDAGQSENRYRIIIFNQVITYLLIPLVSVVFFVNEPFAKWIIWLVAAILLLNYLYRLVHSILSSLGQSTGLLYLFLYLCTLEIAPVLIIVLLVIRNNEWILLHR